MTSPTDKRSRAIGWAITGQLGLFYSFHRSRRDAILHHTISLGRTWAYCRKRGDRAVKVEMRIIK